MMAPDMMRPEGGEELTDHEGRGAEDVEGDDDEGQLDRLDLGPGDDLRGGAEVANTELHPGAIANITCLSSIAIISLSELILQFNLIATIVYPMFLPELYWECCCCLSRSCGK